MLAFFVLFYACYVLAGALTRLIQTKTAGTTVGAVAAYIH